jgi:hypothetical protein
VNEVLADWGLSHEMKENLPTMLDLAAYREIA